MAERPRRRTVGILIFDDVEVLDFCGPFEVFSVARLPNDDPNDPAGRLFEAVTIAEEPRLVACVGGLLVQPQATIDAHPPLDLLVVPGGLGTRRLGQNDRVLAWIERQSRLAELTTSVCTGARLLAARGLLDGRRATTHWAAIDALREDHPRVEVLDGVRVVDEGRVVTAAGISAGIDMALHVVARLHGDGTGAWTAREMEYDWPPRRRPAIRQASGAVAGGPGVRSTAEVGADR